MADRRTAWLRLVNILDGCHGRLRSLPIVSCATCIRLALLRIFRRAGDGLVSRSVGVVWGSGVGAGYFGSGASAVFVKKDQMTCAALGVLP